MKISKTQGRWALSLYGALSLAAGAPVWAQPRDGPVFELPSQQMNRRWEQQQQTRPLLILPPLPELPRPAPPPYRPLLRPSPLERTEAPALVLPPAYSNAQIYPLLETVTPGTAAPPLEFLESGQARALAGFSPAAPVQALQTFAQSPAQQAAVQLLNQRKAGEAYALLAPLEERHAADAEYSYLLGLAALNAGRAGESVITLQRAVSLDPKFAGARMELARAYFEAGDNEEARKEFNQIAKLNPPPETQKTIERFQGAIDERARAYTAGWSASAALDAGYSNNANSGTSANQVQAGGRVFNLDPQSRDTASPYAGLGIGAVYEHPLTPQLRSSSSLRAQHRLFPDARFVSFTSLGASSGLSFSQGRSQWRSALGANALLRRSALGSMAYSLSGGWTHSLTEGTGIELDLSAGQLRYGSAYDGGKVRQWLGGINWIANDAASSGRVIKLGPVFGREIADAAHNMLSRDLYGVQLNVDGLLGGLRARTAAGLLNSDYPAGFLAGPRDDVQASVQFSLELPGLLPGWLLIPQLSLIHNRSSQVAFSYDRVDAGFSLARALDSWGRGE